MLLQTHAQRRCTRMLADIFVWPRSGGCLGQPAVGAGCSKAQAFADAAAALRAASDSCTAGMHSARMLADIFASPCSGGGLGQPAVGAGCSKAQRFR